MDLVIKNDVFEQEIAMCRKLSKENSGKCGWGVCETCGVVPLLYKLHKGELLEDPKKIKNAKKDII